MPARSPTACNATSSRNAVDACSETGSVHLKIGCLDLLDQALPLRPKVGDEVARGGVRLESTFSRISGMTGFSFAGLLARVSHILIRCSIAPSTIRRATDPQKFGMLNSIEVAAEIRNRQSCYGQYSSACGHVALRPTRCGLPDRHTAPTASRLRK